MTAGLCFVPLCVAVVGGEVGEPAPEPAASANGEGAAGAVGPAGVVEEALRYESSRRVTWPLGPRTSTGAAEALAGTPITAPIASRMTRVLRTVSMLHSRQGEGDS